MRNNAGCNNEAIPPLKGGRGMSERVYPRRHCEALRNNPRNTSPLTPLQRRGEQERTKSKDQYTNGRSTAPLSFGEGRGGEVETGDRRPETVFTLSGRPETTAKGFFILSGRPESTTKGFFTLSGKPESTAKGFFTLSGRPESTAKTFFVLSGRPDGIAKGFFVFSRRFRSCIEPIRNHPKPLKGLNNSSKGEILTITIEPKVPFRGFRGKKALNIKISK